MEDIVSFAAATAAIVIPSKDQEGKERKLIDSLQMERHS